MAKESRSDRTSPAAPRRRSRQRRRRSRPRSDGEEKESPHRKLRRRRPETTPDPVKRSTGRGNDDEASATEEGDEDDEETAGCAASTEPTEAGKASNQLVASFPWLETREDGHSNDTALSQHEDERAPRLPSPQNVEPPRKKKEKKKARHDSASPQHEGARAPRLPSPQTHEPPRKKKEKKKNRHDSASPQREEQGVPRLSSPQHLAPPRKKKEKKTNRHDSASPQREEQGVPRLSSPQHLAPPRKKKEKKTNRHDSASPQREEQTAPRLPSPRNHEPVKRKKDKKKEKKQKKNGISDTLGDDESSKKTQEAANAPQEKPPQEKQVVLEGVQPTSDRDSPEAAASEVPPQPAKSIVGETNRQDDGNAKPTAQVHHVTSAPVPDEKEEKAEADDILSRFLSGMSNVEAELGSREVPIPAAAASVVQHSNKTGTDSEDDEMTSDSAGLPEAPVQKPVTEAPVQQRVRKRRKKQASAGLAALVAAMPTLGLDADDDVAETSSWSSYTSAEDGDSDSDEQVILSLPPLPFQPDILPVDAPPPVPQMPAHETSAANAASVENDAGAAEAPGAKRWRVQRQSAGSGAGSLAASNAHSSSPKPVDSTKSAVQAAAERQGKGADATSDQDVTPPASPAPIEKSGEGGFVSTKARVAAAKAAARKAAAEAAARKTAAVQMSRSEEKQKQSRHRNGTKGAASAEASSAGLQQGGRLRGRGGVASTSSSDSEASGPEQTGVGASGEAVVPKFRRHDASARATSGVAAMQRRTRATRKGGESSSSTSSDSDSGSASQKGKRTKAAAVPLHVKRDLALSAERHRRVTSKPPVQGKLCAKMLVRTALRCPCHFVAPLSACPFSQAADR
eukprot:TRINITY_DN3491_c0_g1_i1.p1 TRINITY_DN3491_c0_g1~~TRINITY_DN3491_c0_g1_i1.p1  ORF type:complete len:854 (+),score=161.37 TRINITY_DN3491_c0_g1_i1:179-2740(+)